jgi:hypothetical protein
MKKITILCVSLFLSICSFAQKAPEEKQIQATLVRFFDGFSALSDAAIKAETTPDFTLVEHGLIWTADSLISTIQSMKGKGIKRVNKLVFSTTEQKDNVAWVIYHNTAELTMGDKQRTIRWLESAVLEKQAGAWKIRLLHSTDLK